MEQTFEELCYDYKKEMCDLNEFSFSCVYKRVVMHNESNANFVLFANRSWTQFSLSHNVIMIDFDFILLLLNNNKINKERKLNWK